MAAAIPAADLVASEGYVIRTVGSRTIIAGRTELGALYGTFAFLRLVQTGQSITALDVSSAPKIKRRHLNYWDTERLYAGNNTAGTGGLNGENGAVFNFAATGVSAPRNLPVILDRYVVVARALASLGINGITINNVNANNAYLTSAYIAQEAALADALRPYGVRLALSVRYDAPTDSRFAPDTLTAAQLDPGTAPFRGWWSRKATQIKAAIPDFIGFTVKANSEGQPGPQDFGDDHGDGANGIGAALAPLGMTVFWRTFVYNAEVDNDRLKRPLLEFGPIDDEVQPDGSKGRFADNVFLQTKNGPLDFQSREPLHPMFGRMENTNQAMELQITQEYTGQSRMLTYLGPMWEEVLKTDTGGAGLAGEVVDGTSQGQADTALVGVANLGNHENLTGHHFGQANLFAFGRLAWDWKLGSEDIARDWVRMTWSNSPAVVDTIVRMMMGSWEANVSYETPLGVAHQFRSSDHYGPMPNEWFQRDDWSPVYYNKADSAGLGFNRSPTGSNLVGQYFSPLQGALLEHRHDAREPADVVPPRAVGPDDEQRPALLGRARLPLPDGRAVRDVAARDVGDAAAGGRRAAVGRGAGEARAARGRRRVAGATPASTTGASSAAGPTPSTVGRSRSPSPRAARSVAGSISRRRRTRFRPRSRPCARSIRARGRRSCRRRTRKPS